MLRSLQDGAGNLTIRRTMKLQTIGSAWNDGGQKKEDNKINKVCSFLKKVRKR